MKNVFVPLLLAGILVGACYSPKEKKIENLDNATLTDTVKRGELLVSAIGCNDCHSPKVMTPYGIKPDPERILSGHPADEVLPPYDPETAKTYVLFNMNFTSAIGPWGTSFAANLTPDDTGIGKWSEEQFLKAIKKGYWRGLEGNRLLLPPMPWEQYSHLPDEDIKAIYAYLKTIKPVKNVVPLPFPPRTENSNEPISQYLRYN